MPIAHACLQRQYLKQSEETLLQLSSPVGGYFDVLTVR